MIIELRGIYCNSRCIQHLRVHVESSISMSHWLERRYRQFSLSSSFTFHSYSFFFLSFFFLSVYTTSFATFYFYFRITYCVCMCTRISFNENCVSRAVRILCVCVENQLKFGLMLLLCRAPLEALNTFFFGTHFVYHCVQHCLENCCRHLSKRELGKIFVLFIFRPLRIRYAYLRP